MSLDITPAESLLGHSFSESDAPALSKAALWTMSTTCGVSAANLYYNQPLLADFAKYFHATASQSGWVATAAQVGYGVGILFFVPLGDLLERRRIVLVMVLLCASVLVATASAPNLPLLVFCHLLIGITAMSSQILIPFAIDLTPLEQRGRTVGQLMLGLLCGILLARTLAGFIGDTLGWRFMFGLAAGMMLVIAALLAQFLPRRPPTLRMSYPALMHSMIALLRTQPKLWTSSLVSAMSFGSFMAFWATLSFLMVDRFQRGASEAGLFGVVGVIGALAAPLAGKLSDRKGSGFTVTLSLAATVAAFAIMWYWVTIPSLVVGVLLMDVGVQSIQVAEQASVMALVPDARSRINTLYMVARFVGGAAGTAVGVTAYTRHAWPGLCAVSIAMLAIAMIFHAARVIQNGRVVVTEEQLVHS